jgi:RNA polymerase sigma-70 factor (ECF subfamily)
MAAADVPYDPAADAALLARVAQHDAGAFADLYDRFAPVLTGVASRILFDARDVEDALQEIFLQVWERAAVYEPALGSPLAWLVTLTRNRCIDRLRALQRRSRTLESLTEATPEPASAPDAAGAGALLAEDGVRVRAALRQLPAEQTQAIELAFFGGLTQTQVAERLGEPLGTIKARIRRGLLKLRELLAAAPA